LYEDQEFHWGVTGPEKKKWVRWTFRTEKKETVECLGKHRPGGSPQEMGWMITKKVKKEEGRSFNTVGIRLASGEEGMWQGLGEHVCLMGTFGR